MKHFGKTMNFAAAGSVVSGAMIAIQQPVMAECSLRRVTARLPRAGRGASNGCLYVPEVPRDDALPPRGGGAARPVPAVQWGGDNSPLAPRMPAQPVAAAPALVRPGSPAPESSRGDFSILLATGAVAGAALLVVTFLVVVIVLRPKAGDQ